MLKRYVNREAVSTAPALTVPEPVATVCEAPPRPSPMAEDGFIEKNNVARSVRLRNSEAIKDLQ